MMYDWWGPGSWGGMGFGPVIWLLLIALVIIGVILVSRRSDNRDAVSESSRTALQILDERFAKGEIDKEEYEERRRLLKG